MCHTCPVGVPGAALQVPEDGFDSHVLCSGAWHVVYVYRFETGFEDGLVFVECGSDCYCLGE